MMDAILSCGSEFIMNVCTFFIAVIKEIYEIIKILNATLKRHSRH